MSPAQRKPVVSVPQPTGEGPQLVPPRDAARPTPVDAIARGDPHPVTGLIIIAGIAATGAFTFAATIAMWLIFRNTGVNWMFQS